MKNYIFRTLGSPYSEGEVHAVSYASERAKRYPFPPATSGFFYYRSPPPGAPDIAGDIRFRVTNTADPRSFAHGTDLTIHGIPWLIPLVPSSIISRRFLSSLRRELLLTDEQIRRIENCGAEHPLHRRTKPVYATGQPFRLHTSCQQTTDCWLFGVHGGEDKLERTVLSLQPPAKWGYQPPGQPPRAFYTPGMLRSSSDDSCSRWTSRNRHRALRAAHSSAMARATAPGGEAAYTANDALIWLKGEGRASGC